MLLIPPMIVPRRRKAPLYVRLFLIIDWLVIIGMLTLGRIFISSNPVSILTLPYWISVIIALLLNWQLIETESIADRTQYATIKLAICAVGPALFFLLPHILWMLGTIPAQGTASVFGLLLGTAGLIASIEHARKVLAVRLKKKKIDELVDFPALPDEDLTSDEGTQP